jgi:hypothetical protein
MFDLGDVPPCALTFAVHNDEARDAVVWFVVRDEGSGRRLSANDRAGVSTLTGVPITALYYVVGRIRKSRSRYDDETTTPFDDWCDRSRRREGAMRYLTSSKARGWAGAGLLLAAAGILVQIAGGADYPAVPPGLVILVVAAALVLLVPGRWALGLAALAAVFISVGGVVAPNLRRQLGDLGQTLTFIGSVTQVIGLVTALVFCALAIREAFSRRVAADTGRIL